METTVKKKSSMKESKRKETLFLFCMLILPFVQWLVFWLYVNIQTIALAFQDQRTGVFTFFNFKSFWESLTMGGDIAIAVKNTFTYFSVNLLIVMPLGLLISFFLYKKIAGYREFRIIFYFYNISNFNIIIGKYYLNWYITYSYYFTYLHYYHLLLGIYIVLSFLPYF